MTYGQGRQQRSFYLALAIALIRATFMIKINRYAKPTES